MFNKLSIRFALALGLAASTGLALGVHAQSTCDPSNPSCVVSGTDPEPMISVPSKPTHPGAPSGQIIPLYFGFLLN